MGILTDDWANDLPPLAAKFFYAFARFERAMKRAGYARLRGDNVEADWGALAVALGPAFFGKVESSNRAATLIGRPPKRQTLVEDGTLGWLEPEAVTNTSTLLVAVRRARNNLAHGGKYRGVEIRGSDRDDVLLGESAAVLELALETVPKLGSEFHWKRLPLV